MIVRSIQNYFKIYKSLTESVAMTPLGVSLAFIMISILISVVKHFVFPSSAPSSSQQSSIDIKKLYTITDKRPQKQVKSYSSFYEAFHQFHLSEAEQHKHRIEQNFMKHYNSLVMKKSIINDDFTIVCEEKFIITVSEGIDCNKANQQSKQCSWVTQFDVYELPLLKEQTKQTIKVTGRIGLSKKQLKGQRLRENLKCSKIPNTKKYFVIIPLSNKTSLLSLLSQETWTLNKLTITQNFIDNYDDNYDDKKSEKISKHQKLKNTKQKKPQARAYNSSKLQAQTQKTSQKPFDLKIDSFNLQQPMHAPSTFSNHEEILSYVTESEPWLIRFKYNGRWNEVNILQKVIQERVFQDLEYSSRIPPFDRKDRIQVKNLFVYQTREEIYPINCNQQEEAINCEQRIRQKKKTYLTVVYLHMNNQYRVEKFYVQLTFELQNSQQTEKEDLQIQIQQNTQIYNQFVSPKLISYSLLVSEINPNRHIYSSCAINPKKQQIIERIFDKYFWLYERKLISSLKTYSLLCIFRFQVDEHLKVIEISDLIHSTQLNRYNDFAFLDWKSLNKILNYKENFEKETRIKNVQNSLQRKPYDNILSINNKVSYDNFEGSQPLKIKRSANPSENIDEYLKIFNQEFVQTKKSLQKRQNKTPSKYLPHEPKKKSKRRRIESLNKDKKVKKNKKNKKKKTESLNKENITLTKGSYPQNIEASFDYSLIKKTVFPHRSQVKKYKFPLPFLLSFTQKMQIVDGNPQIPMILFSGVKQFLFTYNYKSKTANDNENSSLPHKIVDYRYLTLGSSYKPTSKFFHSSEGNPQNEIQTVKTILQNIQSISSEKQKQKPTIEIKDETHPEVENVIKTMYESDEDILNQIKSINSVRVEVKRRWSETIHEYQVPQTYQRYLIVVWGWGVEVHLIDWDKNGFLRDNVTQEQIEEKLSKKSSNLIEYFLPFIELFATFYCMFQALISSR